MGNDTNRRQTARRANMQIDRYIYKQPDMKEIDTHRGIDKKQHITLMCVFYGSFFSLFLCFFCLIFFLISYTGIVYYKCDCSCMLTHTHTHACMHAHTQCVFPTPVGRQELAPFFSNLFTTSVWPLWLATYRGVSPS